MDSENYMFYTKKVELIVDKENQMIIDKQSNIMNGLYNILIDKAYQNFQDISNGLITKKESLLRGTYTLRDYVENILIEEKPYLNLLHSKPRQNVAARLKVAYKKFFENHKYGISNKPKPSYKCFKKEWFSILYESPFSGFDIKNNNELIVTCGTYLEKYTTKRGIVKEKKVRIYFNAKLKEDVSFNRDKYKKKKALKNQKEEENDLNFDYYKDGIVKSMRIVKELGKYYAIFTIQQTKPEEIKKLSKWISIDQNHENFFCAVDYMQNTFMFLNNNFIKIEEKHIDELKSKRDKTQKFVSKKSKHYVESRKTLTSKYKRLNDRITKLQLKLRDKKKQFCYMIANQLFNRYDYVIIGDYVPDLNTAKYKNMHRSMLNQSMIGMFRKILEKVAVKRGKVLQVNSEVNTTKRCCFCFDMVKKEPKVREFTCPRCGKFFKRDLNSAVNIGYNEISMLSGTDYLKTLDLSEFKYTFICSFKKGVQIIGKMK